MPLPNPVIVVPGITATYLRDEYALPPEVVWSVMTKDCRRATLHPDNPDIVKESPRGAWYELAQPARVRADQVFEVAYQELIAELRYNLREKEDRPVPVYPFGYDWRQPLDAIEAALAEFIDEVIQRTRLMRHYVAEGWADSPRVDLVGHSMGGMVITGCLQRLGRKARVGKVATLATPYRGSFEAVLKIAAGTANLGQPDASSRDREAARLTPALYHLLPRFKGAISQSPAGVPDSLYDPAAWQPGVVRTLTEFVRLHGLESKDRSEQARELFKGLLGAAEAHRDRIESFKLSDAGLKPEDWLCVVGVGSRTRVRLRIGGTAASPDFDLASDDRVNLWRDAKRPATEWRLTGDGTVPFEGALPSFLPERCVVCVTPDDYSYWEVGDRVLSAASGFHGILPNMDMLHRLIVRHFTGRPDRHGNTWGWPAPGVARADWSPPLPLEALPKK